MKTPLCVDDVYACPSCPQEFYLPWQLQIHTLAYAAAGEPCTKRNGFRPVKVVEVEQ